MILIRLLNIVGRKRIKRLMSFLEVSYEGNQAKKQYLVLLKKTIVIDSIRT